MQCWLGSDPAGDATITVETVFPGVHLRTIEADARRGLDRVRWNLDDYRARVSVGGAEPTVIAGVLEDVWLTLQAGHDTSLDTGPRG
jgi:hypothetical protein